MASPVHNLNQGRFPPLPHRDPSYTLAYSQPRLSRDQEPRVIWEAKVERFTAPDDTTALRKMCEMLGQGHMSSGGEKYFRELTLFKCDHPSKVLRENKVTNVGRAMHTA